MNQNLKHPRYQSHRINQKCHRPSYYERQGDHQYIHPCLQTGDCIPLELHNLQPYAYLYLSLMDKGLNTQLC